MTNFCHSKLYETANGISYLHAKGCVHGDIRGCNILVDPNPRALLCDFGLAQFDTEGRDEAPSSRWQSPEVLKGRSRTFSSDVYSFGMTIYEVRC